jgi:hypothetical protein
MEKQYIKNENPSQAEKWARIISFVFDGSFISVPIFIIICMVIVDDIFMALSWALLCLLFGMIIPFLYIFFLYRKNKIYDIHIPEKSNRMKPLLFALFSYGAGLAVLYILEAPIFLKVIFILTIASTAILTAITYYWKISLHASWITFVVITFNVLLGPWMLLLLPLIPIIGWARVKVRRHTAPQVVMGAGISSIVCFVGYHLYGFINLLRW